MTNRSLGFYDELREIIKLYKDGRPNPFKIFLECGDNAKDKCLEGLKEKVKKRRLKK